jgi:hypothetical protein
LRVNGKAVLDFGVALHDQAWHNADGKVQMSYLAMEVSARESNGIMTFSVNGSLVEPGKPISLEVVGKSPKAQGWFGVYTVSDKAN